MIKINLSLIVVLISVLTNLISCRSMPKDQPWYRNAVEYMKADETAIRNAVENKQSGLEDIALRDKIAADLLKSESPSIDQLKGLLASGNYIDRKVALVNIMFRHVYSEDLFKEITSLIAPMDIFLLKFYSLRCLEELRQDTLRQFEDDLVAIFYFETDQSLLVSAMPTIVRLERSKTIPLFVKYFKNGPEGLRRAAYIYAKRIGEEYFREVKATLERDKAVDALMFIRDAESGRRPSDK
jgi:hypothetical protein